MVTIKIKRLTDSAILPKRMTKGSAGFDLFIDSEVIGDDAEDSDYINGIVKYRTGVAIEVPKGHVGLIRGRSSSIRHGYSVLEGTLDSDFRGEVVIQTVGIPKRSKGIARQSFLITGARIAQLVVVPIPIVKIKEVKTLSKTKRGENGFGSTDKPSKLVESIIKGLKTPLSECSVRIFPTTKKKTKSPCKKSHKPNKVTLNALEECKLHHTDLWCESNGNDFGGVS